MGKIIWLASYPKSGNTWVRAFITGLLNPSSPVHVNNLIGWPLSVDRDTFEEILGFETSELTHQEIINLRPEYYKIINRNLTERCFIKVHDALIQNEKDQWIFPPEVTYKVLYLIRNPLDVAVSYAHHNNCSLDKAVKMMGNENHGLCLKTDRVHHQLPQKLKSWSSHVRSWTINSPFKTMVVRYEDLVNVPIKTFKQIVDFLNLKGSKNDVQTALGQCDFNILKKQEKKVGYFEKNPKSKNFFRQGKVGAWKKVLDPTLIATIKGKHSQLMQKFGYLETMSEINV